METLFIVNNRHANTTTTNATINFILDTVRFDMP